jgi:hypothetical protein
MTTLSARLPLRFTSPRALWASRILGRSLIGGLILYGVFRAISWAQDWTHVVALFTQADHAIYMGQAQRVLAGGPLYPAYELAGPFVPTQLPELYPPTTVYGLFVPMSLLPSFLWWAIPIGIIVAVVAYWRPSEWGWVAVLALFVAIPSTWTVLAAGNPSIWVAAAVALATMRPAVAIFALIKTPLVPFALIGVRSRAWWVALAIYAVVALAMLPAWIDYVHVLLNYRSSISLIEVPLILIPLAAWATRTR